MKRLPEFDYRAGVEVRAKSLKDVGDSRDEAPCQERFRVS